MALEVSPMYKGASDATHTQALVRGHYGVEWTENTAGRSDDKLSNMWD